MQNRMQNVPDELILAWPTLSRAVKEAILTLARTSRQKRK